MLTLDDGIDTDARANRNSDWQHDFPPTLSSQHHTMFKPTSALFGGLLWCV